MRSLCHAGGSSPATVGGGAATVGGGGCNRGKQTSLLTLPANSFLLVTSCLHTTDCSLCHRPSAANVLRGCLRTKGLPTY